MPHRRAVSRAPLSAATIILAVVASACGAQVSDSSPTSGELAASASSAPEASQPPAETAPIDFGALDAGVRYVLDGTPQISFVADQGMTAFPSPGGAVLSIGTSTIRLATGIEEVYVEAGGREPISTDAASVFAVFERNERIAVRATGAMELGGFEAAYVDATVPYYANEEGGAAVFSVDSAPVMLTDLTVNRVLLVEHPDGLVAVIVSGPETADIEEALTTMAAALASIQIGEGG